MREKNRLFPYYTNLGLRNFRGFRKEDNVPLAPLTFLVGPNSSGKSSILDAILLVTQSNWLPVHEPSFAPIWFGPLVDLGSYNDAVYEHDNSKNIVVSVEILIDPKEQYRNSAQPNFQKFKYDFELRSHSDEAAGRVSKIYITDSISGERLTISVLHEQKGQALRFEFLDMTRTVKFDDVDLFMFYRPYALVAKKISEVLDSRRIKAILRSRKAGSAWERIRRQLNASIAYTRFLAQTQRVSSGRARPERSYSRTGPGQLMQRPMRWAPQKIFEGVDPSMFGDDPQGQNYREKLGDILQKLNIASYIERSDLSPYHFQIDLTDNLTKVTSRLIDFGYGTSQAIPVFDACLSEFEGPLLIEQPELHLHPRAQSTVADVLAETSRHRQIVVETHSVHLINRVRIMVAQGAIEPDHVIINYIDRDEGGSHVQTIPITETADFGAEWPGGFFDERYQDKMRLLDLQTEKVEAGGKTKERS